MQFYTCQPIRCNFVFSYTSDQGNEILGYSVRRRGLNYILDFVSGYRLHEFIVILGEPASLQSDLIAICVQNAFSDIKIYQWMRTFEYYKITQSQLIRLKQEFYKNTFITHFKIYRSML